MVINFDYHLKKHKTNKNCKILTFNEKFFIKLLNSDQDAVSLYIVTLKKFFKENNIDILINSEQNSKLNNQFKNKYVENNNIQKYLCKQWFTNGVRILDCSSDIEKDGHLLNVCNFFFKKINHES